nr:MAG TPA: hypothetical protein [Caudoviricetes sp.]DAM23574.1 MAG TPA: hypothetical protein [Caudoviricetes sp.]
MEKSPAEFHQQDWLQNGLMLFRLSLLISLKVQILN